MKKAISREVIELILVLFGIAACMAIIVLVGMNVIK